MEVGSRLELQDVVEEKPPGGGSAAAAVGVGAPAGGDPMESDEWADELPLVRGRGCRLADDTGQGKGKDKSKDKGGAGKDKSIGGTLSEVAELRQRATSLGQALGLITERIPHLGVDELRPMVDLLEGEVRTKMAKKGGRS